MPSLRSLPIAAGFVLAATAASAQNYPTQWSPALAERADVKAALTVLEKNFPSQVAEWIRITEIQGKSQHEQARGAYVARMMRAAGLVVTVDSIGNVTGRPAVRTKGPTIAFAAHMDIVHALGTNLKVRRAGDTLAAPGIFDNSASVANLLAVIRALQAARVKTAANFVFIGTTQEELGFNGMNYWLDHNPRPDLLVGMDGGLGPIDYGALGIYWTKYVFTGAGSHTITSRGKPTPVKALAEAVRRIYALEFPALPNGAVINVGQIHGGVIFNGIPQELYFTMDLRSPNPVLLDSLDREIDGAVAAAARQEGVAWRKDVVQQDRAGGTAEMLAPARAHPIVQTALDIHKFLHIDISSPGGEAQATGSTDANMGVVRGIPSISVGRAFGGNQHTLTEWADWRSALPATRMVLLLAVALADGKVTPAHLTP